MKRLLQGHIDYSFWHKDANLAETNTIIVEGKAVGKMDWHQAMPSAPNHVLSKIRRGANCIFVEVSLLRNWTRKWELTVDPNDPHIRAIVVLQRYIRTRQLNILIWEEWVGCGNQPQQFYPQNVERWETLAIAKATRELDRIAMGPLLAHKST
ncbi:hypothetical protein ASPTUDRAFT_187572 [Aspergillus tubingensis CBS 134.48]|uniref:Uncharacterized protein n=1 Tax=Aspergillus tubingensis (strain CBS 134.48) TaxID=767770 RepID=A0A1L9NAB7_ASPTC|nr:hypothetical protein ASPTUDRAFT_187572 [Aspergillus tubingensis CBS 134.48]